MRRAIWLGVAAAVLACGAAAWRAALPAGAAQARADWEKRWITPLDPNVCTTEPGQTSRFIDDAAEHALRVAGGVLDITIDAATGRAQGTWTLHGVQAPWGWLHLEAPPGFTLRAARARQAALATEARGGHIAVALDACARQACDVALDFITETGAPGRWLPAERLLPRLGLDGDRVLRDPAERARHALPGFVTLPDHLAAVALAGVAPAGAWRWQARVRQGASTTVSNGQTGGALDFVLSTRHESAEALAAEAQAMHACVAARMGDAPRVEAVAYAPEPAPARLSAGTLWLPPALRDDPALRRAEMARAIALRHVADADRLRQTRGAQWLASGLPGAVGLLCATEHEAPAAAQALLQRASAQATQALQAQAGDVGAVAFAAFDGWVRDYAPLAALDPVRRMGAAQIQALLAELGGGVRIQYALSAALGTPRATLALSMPLATDLRTGAGGRLEGERWRWQQGGWKRLTAFDQGWALAESADGALWLDAWPGYERDFADNLAPPPPFPSSHLAGARP